MTGGIGKRLAEARGARGIELAQVEQRLKIRERHLLAMEEERWELLPGDAYVRGFLRTYGDYLGLDGAALARQYSDEHPATPLPDAEQVRQLGTRAQPVRAALRSPGHRRRRWLVIGGIAIAALLAIFLVLGLSNGGREPSEPAAKTTPATTAPAAPAGTEKQAAAEPPQHVSLRLTATGAVWVCLVDDDGKPVIAGVTLQAGQKEGPFSARAFDVTFGNGQVEMEANGDPVPVPPAAEPLGYRVTPDKTSELAEAARPTCT